MYTALVRRGVGEGYETSEDYHGQKWKCSSHDKPLLHHRTDGGEVAITIAHVDAILFRGDDEEFERIVK